ncbi:uncharacterized protein J7T54_007892 [Emericellopsis cladophorae]|uniref:Uncharacterized protein n=1 Tax=Emericellopsis cladophorae TaxID=2686198 RepID=A0A9P9Y8L8_9HYPO|nr:uncharacterized protein J7T54_007892 [Emericellopsis cladophorae]KAI6784799.1 hypothetical protein J7T54_007892 [Emericellopsis cladophorae]
MDSAHKPMSMKAQQRRFENMLRVDAGLEELPGSDSEESDSGPVTPPSSLPRDCFGPYMQQFSEIYPPYSDWELLDRVEPDPQPEPGPGPGPGPDPKPAPEPKLEPEPELDLDLDFDVDTYLLNMELLDQELLDMELRLGPGPKPKDEPEPGLGASRSNTTVDSHILTKTTTNGQSSHRPVPTSRSRRERLAIPQARNIEESCWEDVENGRTSEARTNWACTHKWHQMDEDAENDRMIESMNKAHEEDLVSKSTSRYKNPKEEHIKWAKDYKAAKDASKQKKWEQRQTETRDEHLQSEFVDLSVHPSEL